MEESSAHKNIHKRVDMTLWSNWAWVHKVNGHSVSKSYTGLFEGPDIVVS
jgi:hypothetical protein